MISRQQADAVQQQANAGSIDSRRSSSTVSSATATLEPTDAESLADAIASLAAGAAAAYQA